MIWRSIVSMAVLTFQLLAAEYKTPSLYEISKMNDPTLNEIFYSSKIELRHRKAKPGEPPILSTTNIPPAPPNPNYNGEVPINRPRGFDRDLPPPTNTQIGAPDGLNELAMASGKLAYGGAQVFARGAEQVGRAFGFQPQPQNDFFNQAARLFG